jgi:hypothetical protein
MAYDEGLAERVAELMPRAVQKKMFGGLAFMERGHLICGILGDEIMARVGIEGTEAALMEEGVREFDLTGNKMRGWVLVSQEVLPEDEELRAWIERGRAVTRALPAK